MYLSGSKIYFVFEIYQCEIFKIEIITERSLILVDEISKSIQVIGILKQLKDSIKTNMHQGFRDMQLTAPQGMLMGILAHEGNMKISDLSEKLGLSNSTVSGIIDRLESQKLVERIRSTEDRRVVYVNVSEEFKKNSQERFKKIEAMFETMMSKATPEELEKIIEGMQTLKNVIDRQTKK
mgnify:CR=1 FL=1